MTTWDYNNYKQWIDNSCKVNDIVTTLYLDYFATSVLICFLL